MTQALKIGRVAGTLLLVQGIGGAMTNFVLIDPAMAPPGFLVNAAPHALRVGTAALLGIFIGALAVAIAITVLPLFRKYSERMALSLLALATAVLALAVVENGTVMSMLSLSKAYAASRNWAHFLRLVVGGSIFLCSTPRYSGSRWCRAQSPCSESLPSSCS